MPTTQNPTVAVSAPGKVLLVGGYLVTDRAYTGLVFSLDARINVVAQGISTSQGVQLSELVVESPQFVGGSWRYGYHLAPDDGGITVTQLSVGSTPITPNPFIETTLTYVLTYISRTIHQRPSHSFQPSRLTILADASYYSAPSPTVKTYPSPPGSRFPHFQTTLAAAKKTGLGSSAALVTALTAALLAHYLPLAATTTTTTSSSSSAAAIPDRRRVQLLHNLAQTAHCRAQGKVGSGFDVAAAVHGGCLYRRFSPALLHDAALPAAGAPGFGAALQALVDDAAGLWDAEIITTTTAAAAGASALRLPAGVALRMADVACGSATVAMVRAMAAWRAAEPARARELWDALQARNEALARALAGGCASTLAGALRASRALAKAMGAASGVAVEPDGQTALLDALARVEGVFGGVVPGAGGFDAVALLVRDDEATARRLEAFLAEWSREKGAEVRLLSVRGGSEGVREESVSEFEGWL